MRVRLELFVKSVEDSMNFYTQALGFETVTYQPDDYSVLCKGNIQISLQAHSQLPDDHPLQPHHHPVGLGIEIVLEVDDIDALYAHVQRQEWHLADGLAQRPWGLHDFRLLDPDGFYIRVTETNEF